VEQDDLFSFDNRSNYNFRNPLFASYSGIAVDSCVKILEGVGTQVIIEDRSRAIGRGLLHNPRFNNTTFTGGDSCAKILEVAEDRVIIDDKGIISRGSSLHPRFGETTFAESSGVNNIDMVITEHAEWPRNNEVPLDLGSLVDKNIADIVPLLRDLSLSSKISVHQMTKVVVESFIANDMRFGAASAIRWANGFSFPWNVWTRDNAKLIELGNDFSALVRFRQRENKADRFNLRRVVELNLQESIWKERMLTIAEGIPIITATDFIPTNTPPPLRKKYLEIAPAINKQVYELYQKGLIIILPTEVAKGINGVHFSAVHWTAQHDKEQGRTLADPSSGANPLNTPAAKEIVDRVFGKIEHPTVQSLMDMLIEYGDELGSFENLMLWKRDLAGAFTLVDILPEHVCLCAYELTNNLTMFYHSGFFGHLELPAIFNIINMVSKRELQLKVSGRLEQYVDDFMAVSLTENVTADMKLVEEFATSLLGPKALNVNKDQIGREIVWIGWGINLDRMDVSVSRRNLLKCIHGFYFLELEKAVPIKIIEKLASWCSRYSLILQVLKPLATTLHGEHIGWAKRNAKKFLSPDAILVIWIWRAFLMLVAIHPEEYSRPLLSFRVVPTTFYVEFDASLEGLGIVISTMINQRRTIYRAVSIDTPYQLKGDSSHQNTMEFMAIVFALCLLRSLGHCNVGVEYMGDSMSALSWAKYERFKRGNSVPTALLFMRVASTSFIKVNHVTHIAGVNNTVCDKLSRHQLPSELGFLIEHTIYQEQIVWIDKFFDICNPLGSPLSSHDSFVTLWAQLSTFCEEL